MANFHERLEQRVAACGNPVCLGMDPVLKLIPLEGSAEEKNQAFLPRHSGMRPEA